MTDLAAIATKLFGLEVPTILPVTPSFRSRVFRFVATYGNHHVVKQPWALNKAERHGLAGLT